jgi:AsmA protein
MGSLAMNKTMFFTATALIILLIVCAGVFLAISRVLDEQEIRAALERRISSQLGLPATIHGGVRLSLFPRFHIVVADVRVANRSGFHQDHLLRLSGLEMKAEILPLLFGKIRVTHVTAEELSLSLERDPDGRVNWDGMRLPSVGRGSGAHGNRERSWKWQPRLRFQFSPAAIETVMVRSGSVALDDRKDSRRLALSNLTIRVGRLSSPGTLAVSFTGLMNHHPLTLEGTVGSWAAAMAGGHLPVDLSVKLGSEFSATVRGELTEPLTRPRLDLQLRVDPFSPNRVAAALGETLPIFTADPKALDPISVHAQIVATREEPVVSSGTLDLAGLPVTFTMKATPSEKIEVSFALAAADLDLDRYLPPHDDTPAQGNAQARRGRPREAPPDPTDAVSKAPAGNITFHGHVQAARFKIRGTRVQNLDLQFSADGGVIDLQTVRFGAHGGGFTGTGRVDLRETVPRYQGDLNAEEVQVAPFLREWFGKEFLTGTGEAHLVLQAQGADLDRIRRSLTGQGEIRLHNGALVGVDLIAIVRSVGLTRNPSHKEGEKRATPFSRISSTFGLDQGIWSSQRTVMEATDLRIRVSGEADLREETLALRLEPELGGGAGDRGQGTEGAVLVVPVRVSGSFSSPRFRPELEGIHKKGSGPLHLQLPSTRDLKDLLKSFSQERRKR